MFGSETRSFCANFTSTKLYENNTSYIVFYCVVPCASLIVEDICFNSHLNHFRLEIYSYSILGFKCASRPSSILLGDNFFNFWSSIDLPWGPTQNLSLIGSAVLTFFGYKQTNKETNKKSIYIDCIPKETEFLPQTQDFISLYLGNLIFQTSKFICLKYCCKSKTDWTG